jgi:hypothetical protein
MLSAVPSFILPANGQEIRFGRSSTCSHYKLSSNKLISRVHVKATYHAAKGTAKANIQLKIVGWNGVKVHCQGREYELQKDDICMSEMEDVEIMLDVHGSRVVLEWPQRVFGSSGDGDMSGSPTVGPPSGRVHMSPSVSRDAAGNEEGEPATKVYEDESVPGVGEEKRLELPAPVAETATKTNDAAEASIDMVSKDDDDTKGSDQKSHKVRFTVGDIGMFVYPAN